MVKGRGKGATYFVKYSCDFDGRIYRAYFFLSPQTRGSARDDDPVWGEGGREGGRTGVCGGDFPKD